ncbi:unnamed protein product [Penicillium salamii]|uniref:Uncharacterized protein n=1 Tax=Penicillium salamii TaxID=1612424 RepID=A0A9W4N5Q5_9EURO|nr:unnamed protein product [Penicillium salamii]CAG7996342.1 unnamed protein product [Penicillium salamii]CAG8016117.1 unnamed protein product [Penicillium salamii]CAG8058586.1 unnamed protein product [Penicillium salamii]CAG8278850.1 unnamed protein product [Penicillium salamii]
MVCTRCFNGCFVLILADCDLDFDFHAIWQDSSGIPTPPPCLATDFEHHRQILSNKSEPEEYETRGSYMIECCLHPTYDNLSAFKWMGPDPLSISTQASDMFFYMSAFAFPVEVHGIEFRLVQFDRRTGERIGERLFILPRIETAQGNLYRVREQLLDTMSRPDFGAIGTSFQLSLWPRMEPV